jgi:hypothetical protein
MAQTIEERLTQLEKAHSRLHNQYQNLQKDFNGLEEFVHNVLYSIMKDNCKSIRELKDYQPKEKFIDGNTYLETIEELISIKEVKWDNKEFLDAEVKFVARPEIYKIFVLKSKAPHIKGFNGAKASFKYDASTNKLTKLTIR